MSLDAPIKYSPGSEDADAFRGRYINTCLLDVLQVEVPKPTFNVKGSNELPHVDGGVSFHLHSCQPDHLTIRPDLMQPIWDRFKSAIDPILKVLHVPSLESVITATSNVQPVSKEEEALLFAISYITVRSMRQEECMLELGESQDVLSAYYRLGYEQASARAGFMEATSLMTMQAHVLYLAALRGEADPRAMWAMMGLAARAAQSFGLHRDGGHWEHLSPFSVEMRRRLWWQLLDLDARISEDNGRSPLIAETRFDTQMPLNVHDTDLDKKMHELPDSRTGITNITISLIRFELTNLLRRVLLSLEDEDKQTVKESGESWVTRGQQWIEKTYLINLDTSQPFAYIVATYARLVMSKMWLVIYAPSTKRHEATEIDSDISAKLFMSSVEAIEEGNRLSSDPQVSPYTWYFERDVQWHSMIILLSELCRNSSGCLVDRAWSAIELLVRDRFLGEKGSAQQQVLLWQLVRRLLIKARMTRERKFLEESLKGGEVYGCHLKPLDSHPAIDALLASERLA
ncbi:hypothetical protein F5X68DRAFT_264370 [Plectosphaerella plurivora]|uniref:Xylanolytic transcriptional activator regulatory domain-containing protein n=1 Tax=Plectosphaerella plurivora TaxID=936078 RepID=A0A9P8V597_9PEZI|nr:hypothetical protein F5X68DRAFT_264370 [Plectosphaerella plurivora]